MLKFAVTGKDVSKSLSPKMHGYLLKKMGVEFSYDAVSIPPEEFETRVEELFSRYDGFNVTIPFKTRVMPFLKKIEGDAAVFGAVNTAISKSRVGYNTDGGGFLLMLQNAGVNVNGKRVLLLGAGGAGRSCLKKLSDAGASVFVYERDASRLETVHGELPCFTPLFNVQTEPYDIIFNCTGIGMHDTVGKTPEVRMNGAPVPVGKELLSLCDCAVDLIYEPKQSEFLRVAASLGKKTVNGESMLFYQAYMADCIYLNKEASANEALALWEQYQKEEIL